MKSSRALKYLVLFAVLSLSLGWKVIARATSAERPSERHIQGQVADFLARQHFNVATLDSVEQGKPSVVANSGPCRMLVIRSPAVGWDRDLIRRYAEAGDQIFVVFRGRIYSDQPTLQTVSDALWSRFLRELGFKAWPSPVFAIVATTSCEADRLPWEKLDVARG